jgi:hypothetical protein
LLAVASRVLGEEPGGKTPSSTLRARIRQILTDPDQLRVYLEQLSELERLILQDVIDRKGLCLYRDLLDTTSPKKFDHSRAEQLNILISSSGLVFVVNEGHNKYLNTLMVPRDIQHIVQNGFQADERSLQQIDSLSANADAVPSFILDNSRAVLRDLAVLSGRIDSMRVKRLSGGGLSKTDLKRAAAVFPPGKTLKYASFLAVFLAENGYLVEVNGEWRAAEGFVDSLKDASNVFYQMWRWWLRTSDWSEIHAEGTPASGEKGSARSF